MDEKRYQNYKRTSRYQRSPDDVQRQLKQMDSMAFNSSSFFSQPTPFDRLHISFEGKPEKDGNETIYHGQASVPHTHDNVIIGFELSQNLDPDKNVLGIGFEDEELKATHVLWFNNNMEVAVDNFGETSLSRQVVEQFQLVHFSEFSKAAIEHAIKEQEKERLKDVSLKSIAAECAKSIKSRIPFLGHSER